MLLPRLRRRFMSSICCIEGDPPAPGGGGPQPAPPPQSPPPPPPPQAPPGETAEQRMVRLQGDLATTRAEAAAYRIDARTARETITTLERQITEAQASATAQVDEVRRNADTHLQAERQLRADAELKAAAVAAGLTDVDLLPLIDRRLVKIDSATGAITGIPEAIATFKTSKPTYFRDVATSPPPPPPRSSTGLQNPPPPPGPLPPVTDVKALSKQDYAVAKRAGLAGLRG